MTSLSNLLLTHQVKMYKRKGSTKKGRKSPYKRRSTDVNVRAPRSVTLSSWNKPFRTTLKYSDVVVLATTVGTGFVTYYLQPPSLFDVDGSGTGHQPLRYDQLAAMFNFYRVRSATIKATFAVGDVSVSSSALGPWRCTIAKSRLNATLPGTGTDYATAAEMEGSTTGVLTTQEKLSLYQNFHWSEFGVNSIEELNTATTSNPATGFYWILSVYNQGNVAATSVLCNFDISFDAEFTQPRTIATS